MSELGREPLIRLPIDQEVFIDAINIGDSIEDATVATEVISFQRDGEAYELEGAIVFAGYVRKVEGTNDTVDESFAVGLEDEEAEVNHVNHRMPFTLRVPVSAQTGGFVNVKSRLSGWALDVVNDNWLSVKGTLEIHGLFGEEGYHFRCGLQEEGNAFFTNVTEAVEATADTDEDHQHEENEQADDGIVAATSGAQETGSELELVGASDNMWRHASDDEDFRGESEDAEEVPTRAESDTRHEADDAPVNDARTVGSAQSDLVNEARGGHGWADAEPVNPPHDVRADKAERAHTGKVQNELANLDRFFVKSEETPNALSSQAQRDVEPTVEETALPVASFEFEHQVDHDAEQNATGSDVSVHETAKHDFRGDEEAGPRFTISGAVAFDDNEAVDEPVESEETRHETPVTSVTKSDLWSFVDFNGPEPTHTLRYIVVMDDETIEAVADRCGCTPSELERVNPWLQDQVRSGQALYIPTKAFHIPRVTV